jgi:ribosomal protein S18 acetylase RimI-like enzyme
MPHRYPQEAALRDGRRVIIRPFTGDDVEALYEFFQTLPANLRRLAWDRVEDRRLIESWGRNLDYGKVFPLLALDGKRIVADATLHRREGGPLRLVGRVKWLLDPEYRGLGLGTLLVNHFIDHARANGLRHLTCMLISDAEKDAVETLRTLGFDELRVPGYGADPDGNRHDMVKLVLDLQRNGDGP